MIIADFDRRTLPPDARIGRWVAADGWQHRRFDWAPEASAPMRGRLLFQAGRSDFLEKYLEAFAHWRAQGWAVTAFDWRGQGGSGRRPDEKSLAPLVADLADFIRDWTAEAEGPHMLVAHSMGGHLALRMFADGGGAGLGALVLIAPMLGINSAPIPSPLAPRIAAFADWIGRGAEPAWADGDRPSMLAHKQRSLTGSAERFADAMWWKEAQPALALGAPTWNWLVSAYESMRALAEPGVLEPIRIPILILAAARDRIVRTGDIAAAARRIPGAELHVYPPPAAHELLRETDDIRIDALARIDAFLRARAAA